MFNGHIQHVPMRVVFSISRAKEKNMRRTQMLWSAVDFMYDLFDAGFNVLVNAGCLCFSRGEDTYQQQALHTNL